MQQQHFKASMNRFVLTLITLLCLPFSAVSGESNPADMQQQIMAQIRDAQIVANVPPAAEFDSLLQRDLTSYFEQADSAGDLQLKYKLLRETPTQSGIAYPKYYLWAEARVEGQLISQGAMRVAAVEKRRFEVHQFLSATSIQQDPRAAAEVFPEALLGNIYELAGAK